MPIQYVAELDLIVKPRADLNKIFQHPRVTAIRPQARSRVLVLLQVRAMTDVEPLLDEIFQHPSVIDWDYAPGTVVRRAPPNTTPEAWRNEIQHGQNTR